MKHSEVLSRYVNTGIRIPEEQYDRLSPSLKKSYFRMRSVAGDYFRWEFKLLNDEAKIKYIEKKGKNFGHNDVQYLLKHSVDKDNIATKIIDAKGDELSSSNITDLLKYSINKDVIATKIIETLGKKLEFGIDINSLLDDAHNKDDIAIKIIDIKGEELADLHICSLLHYSINKNNIATKIIEKKGEKLNGLEIFRLLLYPKDKELIKKTLLQNGVGYGTINDVIRKHSKDFDEDIPLIPDNYQSMLNEIRRIKEIMI